ncbi:MAG: HAMP domain-containing histidine kinase [Nocardioides sp.]|nr:HAMP domain-containing histidine kinase [Nocardioides sp.]
MTAKAPSVEPGLSLPWRDRLSLRAQLVAITALLASAVAVGLVIIVQVSLAGAATKDTARVLDDRATALVAAIRAASTDRTLTVPRALLDPGIAVYDEHGTQVAGSVPPSMQEQFEELATETGTRLVEVRDRYSIKAAPFTTRRGVRGVAVIAEPLAPYEHNERAALVVSMIAGALLVLIAAGSAAWISKRVLAPVEHMARTADEWSEHDLERRFSLGPPTNEIRALGNTLDGLLDKVAHVIRAEQRLSAELAHELRTPLTTITGAADLMAMRDDLDEEAREDLALIRSAGATMSNTITVLLDLARSRHAGTFLEHTPVSDLGAALAELPRTEGHLEIDLPAGMAVNVPAALAVRALSPVIGNALAVCDHVRVSARRQGRAIEILVADTGPGIPDAWVDSLFTPGWSGGAGSGLGLSLARRVARSGGGDVTLVEKHNADGGATFAVTFPGTEARAAG